MFQNHAKNECLYHSALILNKDIKTASQASDSKLKELLIKYGSFEKIFREIQGLYSDQYLMKIKNIDEIIDLIKTTDFDITTINDKIFPNGLRDIQKATPVLYYMGDCKLFTKKSIAVVGTRKLIDEEDIKEGEKILERLIDKDLVIVSGLAEGCDTLAHDFTVKNNKKTIAVLGNPIDRYYPRKNKKLQDIISKEHLLVSQYPIGIKTFPSYWAHRNITTVALASEGIVVIRAGDKSGTLHAVKHCVKQGKPLYVLKNNIFQNYNWISKYKDKIIVVNK